MIVLNPQLANASDLNAWADRLEAQSVFPRLIRNLLLASGVVRGYQLVVRPLLPPACRFEPSCSEYARQALLARGLVRGLGLTIWRLCRCHPWHRGGYDPPPARRPTGAS